MKILDMSAGGRAIWIEKDLDFVTFLDRRPEMEPDFVCDTRAIPEEVGGGYDLVVFDPPHVNCGANGHMAKYYGHHTAAEIRDIVSGSSKEAHRVSRSGALMAFKWNDHDMKLDRMLDLMRPFWRPLFGHHMRNRGGSDAKSQSYWVMLLRRDEPGPEIDMRAIGRENKRARTTHKARIGAGEEK
jgi:hypothetical protein